MEKKSPEIDRFTKLANVVIDPRVHKNLKKCVLCKGWLEKIMGNKCIRICLDCNAMYFIGEENGKKVRDVGQLEGQNKENDL